jgi:phage shock protein PspC (stress-responsive transcriptional regulator)
MAGSQDRPNHPLYRRVVQRAVQYAGGDFVDGLSRSLGMDTSIISILMLIIGLMLLYSAVRAFMRASIIMGIIWLMLGLWVLSWVVH